MKTARHPSETGPLAKLVAGASNGLAAVAARRRRLLPPRDKYQNDPATPNAGENAVPARDSQIPHIDWISNENIAENARALAIELERLELQLRSIKEHLEVVGKSIGSQKERLLKVGSLVNDATQALDRAALELGTFEDRK
jgi:hypothetical protein